MNYKYSISEKIFHFKQPAITSRGVYTTRHSYFIHLVSTENPKLFGIGESAFLPGLSCDAVPCYEEILNAACIDFCSSGKIDYDLYRQYPSILFGLETAEAQINAGSSYDLFNTPFARGEEGIPINGLIWMGSYDEMIERIEEKLKSGYNCIKLKVGAIDFEKELLLLDFIRERFDSSQLEIRLDANGSLPQDNVLKYLKRFSEYSIHSIEQPIRQGQWENMRRLCMESPIPIALDEELIGVNVVDEKIILLEMIRPSYIIIKPSLHGGIKGAEEWINIAKEKGIGSWMTSALESNIGLNAIAQLAAKNYGPSINFPQGLGTGLLFTDNIPSSLEMKGDKLWNLSNDDK